MGIDLELRGKQLKVYFTASGDSILACARTAKAWTSRFQNIKKTKNRNCDWMA
jgi:hypothetical protein